MKNRKNGNSYGHILKYTGVFGGVQALGILVSMARNKLVALLLGPGGMGLLSIFSTSVRLVSDTTGMGLSATATRETSEVYGTDDMARVCHRLQVVRSWSMLTAVLGFIVCVLLSPLLNSWSFNGGDYTLSFALLAPVVAMTAITTGELAVLKGFHQLNQLARISVYGVFAALVVSIPLYYIWREDAIVPSLVLVALAQMTITMRVSVRLYPYRISFGREVLSSGTGMLRLGVSFMLAGLVGSGAEFAIRSFMNIRGNLETVGLYNVAYTIAMVYAGMVFSAMETDYFPRISAIEEVGAKLYGTVTRQMEIMLLLVAPLLSALILLAPLLLPLLFTSRFLPAIGALRLLLLAMYFRALTLPMEYINLARGNSKGYLMLEIIFDAMMLIGVTLGFHLGGLLGTGIAWLVISVLGFLSVWIYVTVIYRYHMPFATMRLITSQIALGCLLCLATMFLEGWGYWLLGSVLVLASVMVSLYVLRGRTRGEQVFRFLTRRRRHG